MVEYQNWYQVLRPIGSFINEHSRVEILKLADESDLRLRDKVRSMPFAMNENRSEDTMLREPFLPATPSNKSNFGVASATFEEIIMTKNLKKRPDSGTYLSPKLKDFQDQEKEIKSIFWNLLKTVDPECSNNIDVEAIRDFLKRRQEKLGRAEQEISDVDVFDKYGLGMHARKLAGTSEEDGVRRARGPGVDSLMAMIDKMVEERTKPISQGKDMYDKNNPITGKVGFRRDEINGPREYTDLDEQLDFGDLDKEVDFRKFLVDKGRGRFDSKGNFILNESDRRNRSGKSGKGDQKNSRKKKGGKRGDGGDSDDSDDESKKIRKGKSNQGRPRTASEMKNYLEDLKKSRRYPEWDFPMCNYPKWVHRMYRMDQEKIGQLIKQGMDVPEYCPPWMMQVLDSVWGAKDASTRGEKPSDLRGRKLKGRGSGYGSGAGLGKTTDQTQGDQGGKRGSQKHREGRTSGEDDLGDEGTDRRVDVGGLEDGGSKTSFGIGDFLQGYEKEMLDLAKLESESDFGHKRPPDDSFDIEDMIAEYEKQLQHEEDLLKGAKEKKKLQMDEKMRKMKERQEVAKKKIADKDNKRLQDERLKFENEQMAMEKKQEQLQKLKSSGRSTGGTASRTIIGKRRSRKSRKSNKKTAAVTEPCSEFRTWPGDLAKDEECMKRFKVLLQGRNKIMKENEFIEIVKRMSLFKYEKASQPKTPCDRVKLPICFY